MNKKLIYKPLPNYSNEQIAAILKDNDLEKLVTLPLVVGMHHPNWKFAQDLCLQLMHHNDPRVQENCLLGLEYIARTKGKLEKHLVKPVLINALGSDELDQVIVVFIIERINRYLNWRIGKNKIDGIKRK